MKTSLLITTKNEEESIAKLLDSIVNQTEKPDEVIFADASSADATVKIISSYRKKLPLHILTLPLNTNRSVGRNSAVVAAKYEHILWTDAGCVLDRNWVKFIKQGFLKAPVVAGFYQSDAKTIFEQCVAPYVLVMPDRLNIHSFLPATRSMGITKQLWKKLGGLNPHHAYGEDYAFAKKIVSKNIRIAVQPQAIVLWRPRKNLMEFITMIFRLAHGDAQNRTWRPKVGLIFARYGSGLILLLLSSQFPSLLFILSFGFVGYIVFSIKKNYRYVQHPLAFLYLPILQIFSDITVLAGTTTGFILSPNKPR